MNFSYKKLIICTILALSMVLPACETDFVNPTAPTDEQILGSREGLLALSVGIKQLYSTAGLRWIIETPAITTREGGITTTFQNMIELESGASDVVNFNSNVEGLWATMMRIMSMSEDLIENADAISLEPGTRSGMIAFGHLFKAMSIGSLAQNFEQVVIETSVNNDAEFVSRQAAYEEAISLLSEAQTLLATTAVSDEFSSIVLRGNIDLTNTIRAYLARYNLFAGNYEAAIAAASSVDQSSVSVFTYDAQNVNPIWGRVYQNNAPNFKPRDNFGLPESFDFEDGDGRIDFYLIPLDDTNLNSLPIEDLGGFFTTDTESIPVYIPDEMDLIIAEANVRKASPDLDAAVEALNDVLTDSSDPLGISAEVGPYNGPMTADAILDAIYQNRRAELFLTGISLEDSRRFDRPQPTASPGVFTDERNRNFYPYPARERNNNQNTPADPVI